jgi:HEAT repeat protein
MRALLTSLGFACLFVVPAAAATKEEEVAKYVKDLKSKDVGTRMTAAEEIGKIAQIKSSVAKPALQPLLDTLKDSSPSVRAAAAVALGRLDEPNEVVPALTKLIKDDKEMTVRVGCARGLGQMGSAAKDAVSTLRDIQKEARSAGKSKQQLARATRDALDSIQGRGK